MVYTTGASQTINPYTTTYMSVLSSCTCTHAHACNAGMRGYISTTLTLSRIAALGSNSPSPSHLKTQHTNTLGWSLRLDAVSSNPIHSAPPAVIPPNISAPAQSQQQARRDRAHCDPGIVSHLRPCFVNAHTSHHCSRDS